MSTCNRLNLQALGSQPVMPKNLPNHCTGVHFLPTLENFNFHIMCAILLHLRHICVFDAKQQQQHVTPHRTPSILLGYKHPSLWYGAWAGSQLSQLIIKSDAQQHMVESGFGCNFHVLNFLVISVYVDDMMGQLFALFVLTVDLKYL